MDNISAQWEVQYQNEVNVLNLTNLDDVNQPYSCAAWGNQGSLDDNLMTEDPGYTFFNHFNSGNAFPSNVFIDHTMTVFYKANNISYALANLKFNQMLEACEDDIGASCFQCDDCDMDGTFDDVDNCPDLFNPSQEDADGDGLGDECDDCYDEAGNVNMDGNIDVLDIVQSVNMILSGGINSTQFTACQISNANINVDGLVNVLDVIQLINMVLGNRYEDSYMDLSYASVKLYDDGNDKIIRIESTSNVSGVEFSFESGFSHSIALKDNSHIQTLTSSYDGVYTVVSYNMFNVPFDSHVIEYRIDNGSILRANDLYFVVGTVLGDAFQLTVEEGDTVIYDNGPYTFSLNNVYPNPFNPSTQISFSVPRDGYAKLSAFDMAGKEVDIIHEGFQSAGFHTYTWNASDMSSGVYYLRLSIDGRSTTAKAVLMK